VSLPGMERATAQRLVEADPLGVSLFASNARDIAVETTPV